MAEEKKPVKRRKTPIKKAATKKSTKPVAKKAATKKSTKKVKAVAEKSFVKKDVVPEIPTKKVAVKKPQVVKKPTLMTVQRKNGIYWICHNCSMSMPMDRNFCKRCSSKRLSS